MKTVEELVEYSRMVEGQGIIDHSNCTCTKVELDVLAGPLVDLPPQARIVEIGTFSGRSTSLYFQLQAELNLEIHLIDNWSWEAARGIAAFNKLVLENFNETPFTLHKMRSDVLGPKWNLPINFLYVDGWHDLAGIEPDCQLWLPWVVSGGFAAFHDCDYEPVAYCVEKYVRSQGWTLLASAERMTAWRKP